MATISEFKWDYGTNLPLEMREVGVKSVMAANKLLLNDGRLVDGNGNEYTSSTGNTGEKVERFPYGRPVGSILVRWGTKAFNTWILTKDGHILNGLGDLIYSDILQYKGKPLPSWITGSDRTQIESALELAEVRDDYVVGVDSEYYTKQAYTLKELGIPMAVTATTRKPVMVYGKPKGQSIKLKGNKVLLGRQPKLLPLSAPEMTAIIEVYKKYYALDDSEIDQIIKAFQTEQMTMDVESGASFDVFNDSSYMKIIPKPLCLEMLAQDYEDRDDAVWLGGFEKEVYQEVFVDEPEHLPFVDRLYERIKCSSHADAEDAMETLGTAIQTYKKFSKLAEVALEKYGEGTVIGENFGYYDGVAHVIYIGGELHYMMNQD